MSRSLGEVGEELAGHDFAVWLRWAPKDLGVGRVTLTCGEDVDGGVASPGALPVMSDAAIGSMTANRSIDYDIYDQPVHQRLRNTGGAMDPPIDGLARQTLCQPARLSDDVQHLKCLRECVFEKVCDE